MQKTHLTTAKVAAAATALDALPPREVPLPVTAALAKLAPQLSQLRRRGYTIQDAAAAAAEALGVAVTARQLERALASAKAPRRPQVRGRAHPAAATSGSPAVDSQESQ